MLGSSNDAESFVFRRSTTIKFQQLGCERKEQNLFLSQPPLPCSRSSPPILPEIWTTRNPNRLKIDKIHHKIIYISINQHRIANSTFSKPKLIKYGRRALRNRSKLLQNRSKMRFESNAGSFCFQGCPKTSFFSKFDRFLDPNLEAKINKIGFESALEKTNAV